MSDKNTKEENNSLKKLYILFAIIFSVWILSLIAITFIPFKDWATRGTFGDSFGSINSLFSGLALGGIIYTIFMQKKELSLQREELKNTRKEFTIQNKTLRLQRFENTFFNLLSLHHQIVNSIDLSFETVKTDFDFVSFGKKKQKEKRYINVTKIGRDVFEYKYQYLLGDIKSASEDLDSIKNSYINTYKSVQADFGHYFRNLYRIIKLVDETEFHTHSEFETSENDEKYFDMLKYTMANYKTRYKYTSMIRSQLSDYELLWLFYNCLSDNGNEKFKPLIEKYSLLKNIPKDKLHNNKIEEEYKETAFKKM